MRYRIIRHEKGEKKWWTVERRVLGLFWFAGRMEVSIAGDSWSERRLFDSLSDAREAIAELQRERAPERRYVEEVEK